MDFSFCPAVSLALLAVEASVAASLNERFGAPSASDDTK